MFEIPVTQIAPDRCLDSLEANLHRNLEKIFTRELEIFMKLSDLNRGFATPLGLMCFTNGLRGTVTRDPSTAEAVGDTFNPINSTGMVAVTTKGLENGLALTSPGGDLTVLEVEEGNVAGDLEIRARSTGPVLPGSESNPRLRSQMLIPVSKDDGNIYNSSSQVRKS